ncbi:hypothetical protein PAHAL_3G229700 [Panicum hallii]|uniref:Uncharacterized protein n=1 Tax=Panicum hallii TaxID=206008 RepID=A0A2S3HAV3_9POAL|nr:hypothetical protein PAHAL_3G229700 [Panicum hallii]
MNDMNRRITRTIQSSFGNVVCLQECPIWRKISLGIDKTIRFLVTLQHWRLALPRSPNEKSSPKTSHNARPPSATSTPPRPRAASQLSSTPPLYEVPPRPAWLGAETHGDRLGLTDDRLDRTVPAVDLCSAPPVSPCSTRRQAEIGAGEVMQPMYSRWLPDDIYVFFTSNFFLRTIVNFDLQTILQASKNLKQIWFLSLL